MGDLIFMLKRAATGTEKELFLAAIDEIERLQAQLEDREQYIHDLEHGADKSAVRIARLQAENERLQKEWADEFAKRGKETAELERHLAACSATCGFQAQQIERLSTLMQEFVDRCESGSVRSRYTYGKFKEALAAIQEHDDGLHKCRNGDGSPQKELPL